LMSTLDKKTSTVEYPFDKRQRIYWNRKGMTLRWLLTSRLLPDASMKEEDVQKLEKATHAERLFIGESVKK